MFCDITCGRPMTAPTGWHKQLLCCARATCVVHCTNCLHERGARHSPTGWHKQLICYARASFVVYCTNCLHERGARHSPTGGYKQLLCCARASFVVYCTNCLHERGCEALAYESVYATAMLRSGIICCALYKLSSRTKIVGFVHNNG